MLRVDRQEPARGGERHDEVSGDDERLLVRQGKLVPRAQRLVARPHPRGADQGVQDAVNPVEGGQVVDRVAPEADGAPRGEPVEAPRPAAPLVAQGDAAHRRELAREGDELLGRTERGERDELDAARVLANDVDRLAPDGARRPQKDDAQRRPARKPLSGRHDAAARRAHPVPPRLFDVASHHTTPIIRSRK